MKKHNVFWKWFPVWFIALLACVLFVGNCHAIEVCYDAGIACKMIVEIEECRNDREQSAIKDGMIDSLNGQLSVRESELGACEQGFKKSMALMEKKDALCDARVKDARPKISEKFMWAGVGAVVVTILKILILGI